MVIGWLDSAPPLPWAVFMPVQGPPSLRVLGTNRNFNWNQLLLGDLVKGLVMRGTGIFQSLDLESGQ